ncbi:c-type cytochrome [Litorisediminicola beolgyonensis]|uniref:C-type cytochrome n=1 Tax=Litorisediminicola beolgyonensis TaxID=1173614 RepID=A0ABW3ZFR9_9RHOB
MRAWALLLLAAAPAAASEPDPDTRAALLADGDAEWGAYLAGECTACHQGDGGAEGIPAITGLPRDAFFDVMAAYKHKDLEHPVMTMVAGRLSYEEIAALAAYFEELQ